VAEQTVLVVDDEPRIVEFLSENLTADDYSVLSASNGEEALEVLGRTRPDVLLLDVVLPGISGYEVCRRVRDADRVNDPWDPGIPIIMLSAKAESTDRVRGLQRGALLRFEPALGVDRGHAARAGGRDRLAVAVVGDVARGEDAGHARLQVVRIAGERPSAASDE